ncbi:MAG: hypothetical protein GXY33_03935 [Phycisphaerae bacterium]|nr:hypothetical protein [Phycisphaerae bacterium]
MKCEHFEHFLDRYLDGELKGSLKLEFESHLVECEQCGHLMAMMSAVGEIVCEPAPDEPELSSHFTDRVLGELDRMQGTRRRWYGIATAAAAAAALVVTVASLLVLAGPDRSAGVSADRMAIVEQPTMASEGLPPVGLRDGASPEAFASLPAGVLRPEPQVRGVTFSRQDLGESLRKGTAAPMASLDAQTQSRMEQELRQWLTSTLRDADDAIRQLQHLPGFAFDRMRETLLNQITGKAMFRPSLALPVQPTREFGGEPLRMEPAPVEGNYELI